MSNARGIHEGFMNDSRIVLPRVGVGGGVGVRGESNPPGSSFSSIVTAVEGDKRMAADAARFGGVR